ncbi:unnamed protein product [Didymodactylos carnosus]|uniref:Rhodanese domain-containing protein n=1 Tax=Didymodactylos carnosus TaxID=1234261 RepID=A0A814IDV4_9BILA|nr:unnamed protein product [Didymodactylos carnosus]CAF3793970.1 unnamed protein product [Didymodactylos carnosus]
MAIACDSSILRCKDRRDEVKSEFSAREGRYKISSVIDHLGKHCSTYTTTLSEPVKITLLQRTQQIVHNSTNQSNSASETSSRRSSSLTANDKPPNSNVDGSGDYLTKQSISNGVETGGTNGYAVQNGNVNGTILLTEVLAFNVGRELLVYEFTEAKQPNFGEAIDHRAYKPGHLPTCHDITQRQHTNGLHILVGFSKGQIQYINTHTKDQKVFNESSYLDKTKVTCIKWLPSPKTCYFVASYSSGCLYVFDEQIAYQRDNNIPPVYSTIKDDEKNFSVSYTKSKQARNPVSRWSIGTGSINEFSFSPDNVYLATLSWSPDGKYVATGGEDDFLTIFSLDNDQQHRVVCRGYGHTSWINSISFDPYMNAKTYYSSHHSSLPSSEQRANGCESGISNSSSGSSGDSRDHAPWSSDGCFENNMPSIFYRVISVGQDNRLCMWDITEDILKVNNKLSHQRQRSSLYPLLQTPSLPNPQPQSAVNGYSSLSDTTVFYSPTQTTSKTSFSSLTNRLSFTKNSKVNKAEPTTNYTYANGNQSMASISTKKQRKLSSLSNHSQKTKATTTDTTNDTSSTTAPMNINTQNNSNNNSLPRRTNADLTKNTFGTHLCPKLGDIQLIEPAVIELISNERVSSIIFRENCFLTASQDGIIAVWEKPKLAKFVSFHLKVVDFFIQIWLVYHQAHFGREMEKEYKEGHIPTSVFFDQLECSRSTSVVPRGLPKMKCFENYMGLLGVSNNHHVVVYDRSPFGFLGAARAWWLLRAFGHENVSILNGGLNKWVADNNKLASEGPIYEPDKFTGALNPNLIREYQDVTASINGDESEILVDARSYDEYIGKNRSKIPGAHSGHIRQSVNIPYSTLFDQNDQCLKPTEALKEIFDAAKVDLTKPVTYYCNTGTTAASVAFSAYLLGQKNTQLYYGSWTEWSQRAPDHMIEKGDKQKN